MRNSAEKDFKRRNTDANVPAAGATGPRSPQGKARSSMNALKHGCRSSQTVLRHEDPAEFDAIVAGWFARYRPEDPVSIVLVEETARAHWFLRRARKRLEDVEWNLPMNGFHWTGTYQELYANFLRYRTTAERSFLRFYRELEAHYRRNQLEKHSFAETGFETIEAIEDQSSPEPASAAGYDSASSLHAADLAQDLLFDSLPEPVFLIPPQLPFRPTFVEPEAET